MPIHAEVDGIGTLEFPDGTDPSVIQATVKRVVKSRQQPAPADKPGLMDSLKRQMGLAARYAVEVPARVAGVVADPLMQAAGGGKFTDAISRGLTGAGLPQVDGDGLEKLGRSAGLTARYAVEGPAGIAGMAINPLTVAAGRGNWTDSVSRLLTSAGLPQPESEGEKVGAEVSKAIAGGAPLVRGAQALASGMKAAPGIVKAMAGAPVAELASQGIGAGAAQATRESGGPEWAALLASVAAPMGVQGAVGATRQGAKALNELRRPLTRGGAEQVAADTLGRLTQDKTTALRNLNNYTAAQRSGATVGVPGSRPTAGAVAADYGLIGGEQAIARGDANPLFAARRADNNAARLADLAKLRATKEQVAAYVAKRDKITAPLRDAAFGKSNWPVDYDGVSEAVARLRQTPEGGKQETGRALDILSGWITKRQSEGRVSPRDAYGLHQDINDLIRGKINDERGSVKLAAGMATQVKQQLADAIEQSAPGFRKYLETYSRLSRPIERLETIGKTLGGANLAKVTNAMPQITPDGAAYTLSQDKMRRAIEAIGEKTRPAARQSDVLSRVLGDMNAETVASRGGKQPGSDTYQNIASANFVNRMLGDSIADSGMGALLTKSVGLPMKPFERRINDMIVKAYLDPEEMARLLAKARTERGSPTLAGLLSQSGATALGGLLGGATP